MEIVMVNRDGPGTSWNRSRIVDVFTSSWLWKKNCCWCRHSPAIDTIPDNFSQSIKITIYIRLTYGRVSHLLTQWFTPTIHCYWPFHYIVQVATKDWYIAIVLSLHHHQIINRNVRSFTMEWKRRIPMQQFKRFDIIPSPGQIARTQQDNQF